MAGRPRFITDVEVLFDHLEDYHGISRHLASDRLHQIKERYGISGGTDVVFDYTGNVYHPVTGDWLGSLTEGGAKHPT